MHPGKVYELSDDTTKYFPPEGLRCVPDGMKKALIPFEVRF
jgi:hypothetical protein